jgi:hypothetical protein
LRLKPPAEKSEPWPFPKLGKSIGKSKKLSCPQLVSVTREEWRLHRSNQQNLVASVQPGCNQRKTVTDDVLILFLLAVVVIWLAVISYQV